MKLLRVMQFIWNHPLSKNHRFGRLTRFVQWQIGARLVPGPVLVTLVNDTKMIVSPGMHGATGAVYTGLHECDDMAFVLHCLQNDDLFMDVGANVGSYTLLAAGGVGCNCISVEPVEYTASRLRGNLQANGIQSRVDVHQVAVGDHQGVVEMTNTMDAMNRVLDIKEHVEGANTTTCTLTTIDEITNGRVPSVIKIDVEGFEPQAIAGARQTLLREGVLAVLMETTNSVDRASDDLGRLDETMRSYGFQPFAYDAPRREFSPCQVDGTSANSIYIRDIEEVRTRCKNAPRFRILHQSI